MFNYPKDRGMFDLFSVCKSLIMYAKGSAEPLCGENVEKTVCWLEWRLDTWQESAEWSLGIDNSVKKLAEDVLNFHKQRKGEKKRCLMK